MQGSNGPLTAPHRGLPPRRRTASRSAAAVAEVAYATLTDAAGPRTGAAVLSAVQAAIGADIAGYYSHEWFGWTTPLLVTPAVARPLIPYERVPTAFALPMHPAIGHLVLDRPTRPFRITDLVADRVWQSSALASRMRPDWGRNQQLHIPVAPGVLAQESQVWVLARTAGAFSDQDVDVADALAPMLTAVARFLADQPGRGLTAASRVLTSREVQVLQLSAGGLSSGVIGLRLGTSPRTVQKHLEHVHRKLGVRSTQDAIRVSTELGLDVRAVRDRPDPTR
jgi:DNA-binding CsgD family transcriptional regulator